MTLPKFWIGCFLQPKESFKKWAAEGINIVIQPTQSLNDTPLQRRKAAADAGLYYMDTPNDLADVEYLVNDPACAYLCLPDEPSENEPWFSDPSAAVFVSNFLAKWKPLFDAVKNRKPIWANFGANRVTSGRPTYSGQMLLPYTQGCNVSEVCFDCYPFNSNPAIDWTAWNAQTTNAYNGGHDPLLIPGETQLQFNYRVLSAFCPGMPIWSYIETSKISAGGTGRAPTQAEMIQEANGVIKLGAKGIVFFTHSMGQGLPWDVSGAAGMTAWDGRGPDQVAGCKALVSQLLGTATAPIGDTVISKAQYEALSARVAALEAKKIATSVQLVF